MIPIRKPTPVDYFLLVILALIWGSSFVAIKTAVEEMDSLQLVTLRVVIGFLTLLPWALYRGWIWPTGVKQWALVLFNSMLGVFIPFQLITSAQPHISAGLAAVILGVGPIISLVASHFTTNDDRINRFKIIGILIGFLGIVSAIGLEVFIFARGEWMAALAVLVASFCYNLGGAAVRHIVNIPFTRLSCLVLGISALPLLVLNYSTHSSDLSQFSGQTLFCALYLGLMPTGVAYLLRYHLINVVGQVVFSQAMNLIPIVGLVLANLLLSEPFSVGLILGALLVLAGLYVSSLSPRRKDEENDPLPPIQNA